MLVLIILFLSWRRLAQANPERAEIKRRPVLYRYGPLFIIVESGGVFSRLGELSLVRWGELVVRPGAIQLLAGAGGPLLSWYRYTQDVRMSVSQVQPLPGYSKYGIVLTMRRGQRFDKVCLVPTVKEVNSMWNALLAVGVVAWSPPPSSPPLVDPVRDPT